MVPCTSIMLVERSSIILRLTCLHLKPFKGSNLLKKLLQILVSILEGVIPHSDNGIFASAEFKAHCASQNQKIWFSGSHTHHQNGIAKQAIGTICRCACANLIHLMLCWPDHGNIDLWALAINCAIWVYNRLPNDMLGGLSPDEVWSSTRSDHSELPRAHVFGIARCMF
jgi:hypothetical protein